MPSPQLGRRRRRHGAARLDAGRVRLPRLEEDARARLFPCLRRKDSHWITGPIGRFVDDEKRTQTREISRWSPSQLSVTGHSPFLWTWPPSGPSYKAYSDSTTLPLTCALSRSSPLSQFLSISLCIFIKSSFSLTHTNLFFFLPFSLTANYTAGSHYTMPDASKPIQKGGAPSHLVAYPSLSNSLSSLPQAKSLAHVSVYTSSMSGQHAAESEAKLKKALSSNNTGSAQSLAYATSPTPPPTHTQASQLLMMRKPVRTKLQA